MSVPLKFLHCADLHLDSPFQGLRQLNEDLARQCRAASFSAFDRLVALALELAVDFVLVAGDIYDGAERSLRAQMHFFAGLQKLAKAKIRTYIIHGNHDPLDGRIATLAYPDEVHIFPGDRVSSVVFEREGRPVARIHGVSFPKKLVSDTFADGFAREGEEILQIGLLHCTVGNYPDHHPYVPRTLEQLRSTGLDYWALGHIHKRGILCEEPYVVYPGVLQGRHINEDGPKGCVLVSYDGRAIERVEFEPLDSLRWEKTEVELSDCTSVNQVLDRLHETCEQLRARAAGIPVIARMHLTGRSVVSDEIAASLDVLLDDLREQEANRPDSVYVERLEFDVAPGVDLASRAADGDLIGEVVRQQLLCAQDTGSLRSLLEPLWKKARLGELTDDCLHAIIYSSAQSAADQLMREA